MGAEVRAGSAAYAALYNMVRYERSNPYQNHPLLPFNVLTRLSPRPTGSQRFCGGCQRDLDAACFNKKSKLCYVCGCVSDRIRKGLK